MIDEAIFAGRAVVHSSIDRSAALLVASYLQSSGIHAELSGTDVNPLSAFASLADFRVTVPEHEEARARQLLILHEASPPRERGAASEALDDSAREGADDPDDSDIEARVSRRRQVARIAVVWVLATTLLLMGISLALAVRAGKPAPSDHAAGAARARPPR